MQYNYSTSMIEITLDALKNLLPNEAIEKLISTEVFSLHNLLQDLSLQEIMTEIKKLHPIEDILDCLEE